MEAAGDELQSLAERCLRELHSQGFCVIPGFLDTDLEELRLEADTLYEVAEEERQRGRASGGSGGEASGVRWGAQATASCIYETIPGHRCTAQLRSDYAAYHAARSSWPLRPAVWRLLFQSRLTQLVLALLGPQAVLFNDQYILKPPASELSAFKWHRDSDWCRSGGAGYRPYLSVWCALDDMTQGNGCFVVRPGSHLQEGRPAASAGAPEGQQGEQPLLQGSLLPCRCSGKGQQQRQQQHHRCVTAAAETAAAAAAATAAAPPGTQEEQPPAEQQQAGALPLEVPAGTAVITSDTVLHCSGPNRSRHMRRAWMPQFSSGPILWRGGGCVSLAVPLAPPPAGGEDGESCRV